MSHTPGPWKNDGVDVFRSDEGPVWVIEDEAETNICLAFVFASGVNLQVSEDEAAANANLIAAAPDLLAACEEAQRGKQWGQGGMDSDDLYQRGLARGWRECADTLKAAIAKAKGES